MASAEYNIESLVIAILQASATFTSVPVEHWVEDEDTTAKANRLTVRVEPRIPMAARRRPDITAEVWQAPLTISAQHKDGETALDDWRAAIDAAITGTPPAGVVTTATSLFPNGVTIDNPDGGAIFDGSTKRRTLIRTFRVVFMT
jgi:hypothetical protein